MDSSPALHRRVFTDFLALCEEIENDPSIDVFYDDTDISRFKVGIRGQEGTPYVGGYYLFEFLMNDKYPFASPSVEFLSRSKRMRIHPNFYDNNGKVCLSILGTWPGPSWTAGMTLHTVVIAIQSLFSNNPITNEPGYESAPTSLINRYNNAIIVMKHNYLFKCITQRRENKKEWDIAAQQTFTDNIECLIRELINFSNNVPDKDNTQVGVYGLNLNIKSSNMYKNIVNVATHCHFSKEETLFLSIFIWCLQSPDNLLIPSSSEDLSRMQTRQMSSASTLSNPNCKLPNYLELSIFDYYKQECQESKEIIKDKINVSIQKSSFREILPDLYKKIDDNREEIINRIDGFFQH